MIFLDKTNIGNRIRYERQRLGLTLEELGNKIGVSKQCLSGWEHGRNTPDVFALNTLAKVCQVEIKDFLTGVPGENVPPKEASPTTQALQLTEKEAQLVQKLRALSTERRKAVEILFGIRDKK